MKTRILFFLLIISSALAAQSNQSNWQIGYYGDVIIHPGLKIGYEQPFHSWEKTRKDKVKKKALLVGGEFIYYYNKSHHHGLIVGPNISYKRTKESTRFIQWKLMAGLHQSIYDGTTYEVLESGEVKENKLAGQTNVYSSLSFLFGRNITSNLAYYSEIGVYARYPYNHSFLPGLQFSLGVQYLIK